MFENQESLKPVIRKYLSTALNPKPKKSRYSLEREKAKVLKMVGNMIQENIPKMLKSIDIDKIIIEKLEDIDWKKEAREAVEIMLKRYRGIVE